MPSFAVLRFIGSKRKIKTIGTSEISKNNVMLDFPIIVLIAMFNFILLDIYIVM